MRKIKEPNIMRCYLIASSIFSEPRVARFRPAS